MGKNENILQILIHDFYERNPDNNENVVGLNKINLRWKFKISMTFISSNIDKEMDKIKIKKLYPHNVKNNTSHCF